MPPIGECRVFVRIANAMINLLISSRPRSDDSLGYEFPFTLRAVTEGGRVCALCSWSKFCRGCEIPCNDEPLLRGSSGAGGGNNSSSSGNSSCTSTPKLPTRSGTNAQNGIGTEIGRDATSLPNGYAGGGGGMPLPPPHQSAIQAVHSSAIHIAIDWDPTALHLRYQSTREKLWTNHESVATCRRQQTEPVDLDHCLRAFTSEEKLEQWYHCAHCKGKKPATKKLQIWRLPPILVSWRFWCI